jgi:16S rRNA processing protein RimM
VATGGFIRIGQIVGAFGLRGEVKVQPLTDFEERFRPGARLRLKGDWVTIETSRDHKGRPLLKLSGIDDLTTAEALQWEYLEGIEEDLPELDEDEFLAEDLIGLRVVTASGEELGKVDEVLSYPAQDILRVGAIMIPMVEQFVREIDLDEEKITVELIPGMRPEDEEFLA